MTAWQIALQQISKEKLTQYSYCPYCGGPFLPAPNKVFCRVQCQRSARHRRGKEQAAENKGVTDEYLAALPVEGA
jgi:hypothetical protein